MSNHPTSSPNATLQVDLPDADCGSVVATGRRLTGNSLAEPVALDSDTPLPAWGRRQGFLRIYLDECELCAYEVRSRRQ